MAPTRAQSNDYQTQLKVWGTSRAVRIPKFICDELRISSGSVLEMECKLDERGPYLTIRPADEDHRSFSDAPYVSMDELFAGYEASERPTEADWGEDVGGEVVA